MSKQTSNQPTWYEGEVPKNSFRSIFKWGEKNRYKHPGAELVNIIAKRLKINNKSFSNMNLGLDKAKTRDSTTLEKQTIQDLEQIVGVENVNLDDYARIKASFGQAMIDILRLRERNIENLPEAVLHPRNKGEIKQIIEYCNNEIIPVYIRGGGTSVTRGFEAVKGGISLDLSTYFNNIIHLNENNQTITVEPGIYGPDLENLLNNAQKKLSAQRNYTCGHFPQSFEFSTVGGWISTRSAGQNSTYYGKIEDLVVSQEYITPMGTIKTNEWPRAAIGPDMDQIMIGSEGVFGVLVEATLKIFRLMPENKTYFSFMFKSWNQALSAAQEIMQAEAGFPSVFRISDSEETDIAMHLYKIADSPADQFLKLLGFQPMKRCLMLGYITGEKHYCKNLFQRIKKICRRYGTFNLSKFGVTQRWERSRFQDPYMRDDLCDIGIITDTLECAVTWEMLPTTYSAVRDAITKYPNTITMTHLSHAYPQGGNLYFIFMARFQGLEEYLKLQYSILDAILESGAAISHHHGIGKHLAPWFANQIGIEHLAVLRALKNCFDPNNIMNPGGTLGLDMSEELHSKKWGI